MLIAGLDISLTSTGMVKFNIDNEYNIIDIKWEGFTDKKWINKEYSQFNYYKKFDCYLDRSLWMKNIIDNFCKDVEYIAIENYSFGSDTMSFHIGEFTGLIKMMLYLNNKKIRLYDIISIKKYATSKGTASKLEIINNYRSNNCLSFDNNFIDRMIGPSYNPLSDIIDAYYITDLLYNEIRLRKGVINLKDLDENKIWIFNRVTKNQKENILSTNFIYHEFK